jgi:calcium-translocating P-type ATPase
MLPTTPSPWRSSIPVDGLSSALAAERLLAAGRNELPVARPPPIWRQLAGQLFHFFAVLLWVAGALAIVAGMAELGVAIFLVVIVNGLFAFVQEHRAERAAQRLQALLPRRAVARRDGQWLDIDAEQLVVGDLLALTGGDRVSADIVLSRGSVTVDTSTLTGESVPVAIGEREEAFAGTFVVEGEAQGFVTATGKRTRLARIAELTEGRARPPTPLARELHRLVRAVALVALAIGTVFFVVGAFVGLPLRDGFLFAIGVAVALVPEGLLPTVTLSLALGAWRMAKRGALVRKLDAVETLGSTTFICSDKTGTLTKNEMSAVEIWTPLGVCRVRGEGYQPTAAIDATPGVRAAAARLALTAVRCSTGRALKRDGEWIARGDPMEAALHALGLRLDVDVELDQRDEPETARFPFDPRRRRMSVTSARRVFVKGASDAILPLCHAPEEVTQVAAALAARGLRVLAVATRTLDGTSERSCPDDVESDLELCGLVGLVDPPRPEVRGALAACAKAGLRVAMVTGDHPVTARAIAVEIGMGVELVVTGDELPEDEAMLGALMDRDGVVACRVTPEQKLLIARALQARGHVVAMTGDGVNDGPALRQADVGVAMGKSGTDVARAAADLVLLDDRFETIVYAIEQGRSTFANIRRFLTYHLTDNVAELAPFVLWAFSGGRFPLALGVLQILCLDLVTDQLPALALGAEPPTSRALEGRPATRHLIDRGLLVRAFGVLGPAESLVQMVAFVAVLLELGWRPGQGPPAPETLAVASGTAFVAIVAGQSAVALVCRSASRPFYRIPWRTNPFLLGAIVTTWILVLALLFVPWLARHLGHAPPTVQGTLLAATAFPVVLLADAARKAWLRRAATERAG